VGVAPHEALDERPAASANAFRREGDYWSVYFDGQTVHVRDLKGMQYLARLFANARLFDVIGGEVQSRSGCSVKVGPAPTTMTWPR